MSIFYKFSSAIDSGAITFDGSHISVGELKIKIVEAKQLSHGTGFDLVVCNAQTGDS